MVTVTYRCNNPKCGKIKGDSNHWVCVRPKGASGTILSQIIVLGFEDCGPYDEHYCGPACAIKRISEFLDQLRAESQQIEWSRQVDEGSGDDETDVVTITESDLVSVLHKDGAA